MTMVSIIVPAYNVEGYIANCLDSLTGQTYADIEIIVIDDGSTDRTAECVDSLRKSDGRIKLIRQSNGGAAKARNVGLSYAAGDFVMFVDGDDMLSEDTVFTNLSPLLKDETLDWVTFPIVRVDKDNNMIDVKKIYGNVQATASSVIMSNEFVPAFRDGRLSGVCCGALYRKNAIAGIQFPEGEYYEDSFFFTRLLCCTNKGLISARGSYRYVHRCGSSQLQRKDAARLNSATKCLIERMESFRKRFPGYEALYQQMEKSHYYFLKVEKAKKTIGIDKILTDFTKHLGSHPSRDYKTELKCWAYNVLGYDNIKRIVSLRKS